MVFHAYLLVGVELITKLPVCPCCGSKYVFLPAGRGVSRLAVCETTRPEGWRATDVGMIIN